MRVWCSWGKLLIALGLPDYSQVDILGVQCKSVNFGSETTLKLRTSLFTSHPTLYTSHPPPLYTLHPSLSTSHATPLFTSHSALYSSHSFPVRQDPKDDESVVQLGKLLIAIGEGGGEEGVALLRRALKQNPKHPQVP